MSTAVAARSAVIKVCIPSKSAIHQSLQSIHDEVSTDGSVCGGARSARRAREARSRHARSAWWRVVALACSARGEGAPVGKALMSARAVVQLGEGAAHLTIVGCPDRRLLHRRSIGAVDGLSIGAVEELSGPDEIVKGGVRVRVRVSTLSASPTLAPA